MIIGVHRRTIDDVEYELDEVESLIKDEQVCPFTDKEYMERLYKERRQLLAEYKAMEEVK